MKLAACQRAIREAVGLTSPWMRPPYGAHDRTATLVARANGYTLVNWSADGMDWTDTNETKVAQAVVAAASPGGIILLHDGWNNPQPDWPEPDHVRERTHTVRALPTIIMQLRQAGYRFIALPELARARKPIKQMWF
ncbi:MAG: polysaccharide deacetylase family protein [Anaerolineae bacterium]|nr:polysaccharide deacetylase family protein [Anaerolineae bacterium]